MEARFSPMVQFLFVTLLCVGCAKNEDSKGGGEVAPPNVSSDSDADKAAQEVRIKIDSSVKTPDIGDFRESEYLDRHDLASDYCLYITREKVTTSDMSTSTIQRLFQRTSKPDAKNPTACPPQHPEFAAREVYRYDIEEWAAERKDAISKTLNSAEYLKSNPWVASLSFLGSKEVRFKGLRTQIIEWELTATNGSVQMIRWYVSLESLVLGVFQFERVRKDTGAILNYEKLISYNIKQLGTP